jgi:hypothetical protein
MERRDGFNASMYGFWDYWKHNILNQIMLAKSEDCLHREFPNVDDLLTQSQHQFFIT